MTDEQVAALIKEFHTPLHVQRHCKAVSDFALELGRKFQAHGHRVNLTLLKHAALLHDIVRIVDFRHFNPEEFPDPYSAEDVAFWKTLREKYKGMHHAIAGAQILEERGFEDVARIVARHGYLQILEGFSSWEEKLLYYADKRTKHDTTVSLQERLEDGRRRNAPETIGEMKSAEIDKKVFALEEEILAAIK